MITNYCAEPVCPASEMSPVLHPSALAPRLRHALPGLVVACTVSLPPSLAAPCRPHSGLSNTSRMSLLAYDPPRPLHR